MPCFLLKGMPMAFSDPNFGKHPYLPKRQGVEFHDHPAQETVRNYDSQVGKPSGKSIDWVVSPISAPSPSWGVASPVPSGHGLFGTTMPGDVDAECLQMTIGTIGDKIVGIYCDPFLTVATGEAFLSTWRREDIATTVSSLPKSQLEPSKFFRCRHSERPFSFERGQSLGFCRTWSSSHCGDGDASFRRTVFSRIHPSGNTSDLSKVFWRLFVSGR